MTERCYSDDENTLLKTRNKLVIQFSKKKKGTLKVKCLFFHNGIYIDNVFQGIPSMSGSANPWIASLFNFISLEIPQNFQKPINFDYFCLETPPQIFLC